MLLKRFLLTTSVVVLVGGVGLAAVPSAKAQWYISANAGGNILSDADTTDSFTVMGVGVTGKGDTEFDNGFGLTGAVGYSSGNFRVEAEFSYRKNDLDKLTINSVAVAGVLFTGLGTFDLDGDTTALGFMANGWYDFYTGTRWVPFVGAGLGVARLNIDIESIAGIPTIYDESDTVLAYQAGVGLGYKVTPKTIVSLSYRFFGTADPEFDDGFDKVDSEYSNHSLLIGVLARF